MHPKYIFTTHLNDSILPVLLKKILPAGIFSSDFFRVLPIRSDKLQVSDKYHIFSLLGFLTQNEFYLFFLFLKWQVIVQLITSTNADVLPILALIGTDVSKNYSCLK